MKITDIKTFLMMAGSPDSKESSSWSARNWCFVKVYTDEGIIGLGEGSGWPRVVETAINDLKPIVIGEDPMNIERIWQKMLVSTMGAGMTGTPGSGSMNAIDMALWDIKGKALNTPVWNLLGGKVRERIRAYGHAGTPERALELKERGLTAVKTGGVHRTVEKVDGIRKAVGDQMDIMVDAHGPPWFTTKDAIIIGKALEPYKLLFYEDPVPPDNIEALQRVQDNVDIPIAAGERHSHIWGVRQLIEREIVDVVQPDTGRIGGISQMMKIAAMAEAHYITVAPHSGSLGPIAEYAAIHVLAAIPNALILERVHDDVPVRYEMTLPHIQTIDGHIEVPDRSGLGVDIDEDVVLAHPSKGNTSRPGSDGDGSYESGTFDEHVYVQSRY
ncbi:MAG: mandelate racemase/muconate lactonizing enzyme family protein, partial [Dehalococcoidia bacterium]|nr:mandelate racemase/muconate lactonizing enzyme family protein [Dehalococcoidia bacterium]